MIALIQLARWDRPIGWQLLLAPCWWAVTLGAISLHQPPSLTLLALLFVGAVAMRGAGCTYDAFLFTVLPTGPL